MAELPVPSEKTLDFENYKRDMSFLLIPCNVTLVLACTLLLLNSDLPASI